MFGMSDASEGLRTFAATVVHEVRTPLSSLRLCIEGLACAEGLSGRDRRRVELALGQIDHLEDLTSQMRFLSVQRPSAPDPTDVHGVVREVAKEMAEMALGRGIQVCARCDDGLPRVEAGRGSMRRVLVNLCRNGLQAMDGRAGVLRIWARRTPPEGVEVGVQDTGCGISASVIERVWDPFFTTKSDGMGIGLTLVKSLVEERGGQVRMESESGRGTTVTVWFRACRQEVEDAEGAGD